MQVRLQKYLADRGVGSRRKCEEYIADGLIRINGKVVTEMGVKVDPEKDAIEVSPEIRMIKQKLVYIMLNKPAGYVTTRCQSEGKTVYDLVGVPERIFSVGRLDKDSSGLLLLTNDGEFAYQLAHPSFEHEKEYEVTVEGNITAGALDKLRAGVKLWGSKTLPTLITKTGKNSFRIVLREGKNRQIRRICRKVGYPVKTLKRVRIGSLTLGSLPEGQWKYLQKTEIGKFARGHVRSGGRYE